MDDLAGKVADKLAAKRTRGSLTHEDVREIKDFLATKKNAIKIMLWIFGATAVWALKDLYVFFRDNIKIFWGP